MAGHPALENTLDHVAASHYSSSAPEGQVFLLGLGDTCGLLLELLSLDLGLECVDRVGSQQHGAGPRWLPQVPWAGPGVSQATVSEAPSPGKRTTELVPWRQSHILPTALCCPWSSMGLLDRLCHPSPSCQLLLMAPPAPPCPQNVRVCLLQAHR